MGRNQILNLLQFPTPPRIIPTLHFPFMNEIEIYKTRDGKTEVEVQFGEDTVWLTQTQLMTLFKSSKANVSEYFKNIFQTGDLDKSVTVWNFRTVCRERKRRVTRYDSKKLYQ